MSTRQEAELLRAHERMLSVSADWITNNERANGAKVYAPRMLTAQPRPDHAILYGCGPLDDGSLPAIRRHYQAMMQSPSESHPLVMEPVAPGVAYGESYVGRPPADPSFGTTRTWTAAKAICLAMRHPSTERPLPQRAVEQLNSALDADGYDLDNPARVARRRDGA